MRVSSFYHKHKISFKNAFEGIAYSFRTQPNFRFHFLAALGVLLTAWFLKVSVFDFFVLTLLILFVLMAEMINTSLESITDLVTEEWRQKAKIAKDVSAGMVLITAIFAAILGVFIFSKYLL